MFIDILAKEVIESLADLGNRLENPEPLMRDLAAVMEEAVAYNFDTEGQGEWEPLTETTTSRRRNWPGKILQDTRQLASSVSSRYTKDEAIAGTSDIRAATQQFGAKKGEYGETVNGAPIPWGDIPAREFLYLTEPDIDEMEELAVDYFGF